MVVNKEGANKILLKLWDATQSGSTEIVLNPMRIP